jgi:hypothetical protein
MVMVTTSKSANKKDYDDKGTYDNLREGNRNISSSTSTLITAAARARTALLAKLTSSSWRGEEEIIVYAYVDINDGNSK